MRLLSNALHTHSFGDIIIAGFRSANPPPPPVYNFSIYLLPLFLLVDPFSRYACSIFYLESEAWGGVGWGSARLF